MLCTNQAPRSPEHLIQTAVEPVSKRTLPKEKEEEIIKRAVKDADMRVHECILRTGVSEGTGTCGLKERGHLVCRSGFF